MLRTKLKPLPVIQKIKPIKKDFTRNLSQEHFLRFLDVGIKSPYEQIVQISFGVASPREIMAQSVCNVESSSLKPDKGTVYDPRMGGLGNKKCETCFSDPMTCAGHWGHIELFSPVISPLFQKTVFMILKTICFNCSSSLISREKAELLGLTKFRGVERLKAMVKKCKGETSCSLCGKNQYKFIQKNNNIKYSSINSKTKKKTLITLTTKDIYDIFLKISSDDFNLLGFNENLDQNPIYRDEDVLLDSTVTHRHETRPEWFIFTVLPVIPPCSRPWSYMNGEQHDDDITAIYIKIININQKLKNNGVRAPTESGLTKTKKKKKGAMKEKEKKQLINELEETVRILIDNKNGQSKISGGRAHKSYKERFSGKGGRVRDNLQGKRVNFSARTVAGGGPTSELCEIEIPREVADTLTTPEMVTIDKIVEFQKLVDTGKVKYISKKGAEEVIYVPTLLEKNTEKTKSILQLKVGDAIERVMMNDDWVLFNRQPTLRVESMMGFKVKVVDFGKTFRFNISATTPFNADKSLLATGS